MRLTYNIIKENKTNIYNTMLSLITIICLFFSILIIYQIVEVFFTKRRFKESFLSVQPLNLPYIAQPGATNFAPKTKPVNTYYRNAKFNIDIQGHSVESELKVNK
jgi:hypothetical protein